MSLAILYWQFSIASALGFAAPEGNHTAQPFEIKDLTAQTRSKIYFVKFPCSSKVKIIYKDNTLLQNAFVSNILQCDSFIGIILFVSMFLQKIIFYYDIIVKIILTIQNIFVNIMLCFSIVWSRYHFILHIFAKINLYFAIFL